MRMAVDSGVPCRKRKKLDKFRGACGSSSEVGSEPLSPCRNERAKVPDQHAGPHIEVWVGMEEVEYLQALARCFNQSQSRPSPWSDTDVKKQTFSNAESRVSDISLYARSSVHVERCYGEHEEIERLVGFVTSWGRGRRRIY